MIEKNSTLSEEVVDQLNDKPCDVCSAKQFRTKSRTLTAPSVLAIHIVRESVLPLKGEPHRKRTDTVEFPLELNLNGHLLFNRSCWPSYSLRAFVYHKSVTTSLDEGHYIAVVTSGGRWFHCDDNKIDEIREVFLLFKPY